MTLQMHYQEKFEEGMERGIQKGMERGMEQGKRQAALRMLESEDLPVEKIAEYSGLMTEQVEELEKERQSVQA